MNKLVTYLAVAEVISRTHISVLKLYNPLKQGNGKPHLTVMPTNNDMNSSQLLPIIVHFLVVMK